MKHKFLTVLLAAVFALGACFGLTACGENGGGGGHTHSFTNYVYNNDATCTKNGTETAKCNGCEQTDTREKANSALGHEYTVENKCSVCGAEWEYTKSDALEYTKVVLDGVEGYDVRFGEYTTSELVQVGDRYEIQYHDKGTAFEGEKVVFPYGYNGLPVISIGRFHACTSDTVKSITVPQSVISWGYGVGEYNRTGAFSCSALEELNLPDGLSVYTRQEIATNDSFAAYPLCMVTLFDGIKKKESEICPLYDDPQYRENGALYIGNYLFGTNFEEPVDTFTVKDGTRVIVELKGAKHVVLPDSVEVIGNSAFSSSELENIEVGNGIEEIGMNAFYMSNLTSITLPDKPIYIGTYAFEATPFMENDANWEKQSGENGESSNVKCLYIGNHLIFVYGITVNSYFEMKPGLKSIAGDAFKSGGFYKEFRIPSIEAWFNVRRGGGVAAPSTNKLIVGGQEITEITIPSTVTEVPDYAFAKMMPLTSVTLHNGITRIGDGAFAGCENLTNVTLGSGVKSIGDSAFYNCRGLKSFDSLDSVTTIGNGAFGFCQELKSVTLGSGLKTIGNGAFNNCGGLTSIDIPDSVISIGSQAFMGCGLTSVTIGRGVTLIGEYAFYYRSDIQFKGTVAEWQAIEKRTDWIYWASDYTVTCTDGTVDQDGNVTYFEN